MISSARRVKPTLVIITNIEIKTKIKQVKMRKKKADMTTEKRA